MRDRYRKNLYSVAKRCDEISESFVGTHHEDAAAAMKRCATNIRSALQSERKDRPTVEKFFDDQQKLLEAMKETQALIHLSMDQSRPMTREQVCAYLSINNRRLSALVRRGGFPGPHIPSTNDGLTAGEWWRKHEIDDFLFKRPHGPSLKLVVSSNIKSADRRYELVKKGKENLN